MRIVAKVEQGKKLGRLLGFPTLNLAYGENLNQDYGVYAGVVWIEGERYQAAVHWGPKFIDGREEISLEAHVLDFDADVYGQDVELEFLTKIRDVRRFASLEDLKLQIAEDVVSVRELI